MNATTISYQQTATKEISLRIETTFGFEVVVISTKQALKLAAGLKETVSCMPNDPDKSEDRLDALKLSSLVWLL